MDDQTKREVEARGATLEAAIAEGLKKLSLKREEVEVEVVDEGSRGLLGIGSRDAIVRLRPIAAKPAAAPTAAPVTEKAATSEPVEDADSGQSVETVAAVESAPAKPEPAIEARPAAKERRTGSVDGTSDEALTTEQEAAVGMLTELLDKMHVDAEVSASLSEPDDLTGQQVNVIEITGEDLGILIGPRGETLEALQFLSRLMVAHQLQQRANFVVDVEGYRERRRQALTRLAERMADKARERGQPVSLEPMSSYERRVIHMALRDAPDVYTESTGEGKYRKVRIFPK